MNIIGKWERKTHKYANGEIYRVGKIVVASADWDGTGSRGAAPYVVLTGLPGIKQPDQRYATIDEAKARAERLVATWFS